MPPCPINAVRPATRMSDSCATHVMNEMIRCNGDSDIAAVARSENPPPILVKLLLRIEWMTERQVSRKEEGRGLELMTVVSQTSPREEIVSNVDDWRDTCKSRLMGGLAMRMRNQTTADDPLASLIPASLSAKLKLMPELARVPVIVIIEKSDEGPCCLLNSMLSRGVRVRLDDPSHSNAGVWMME